MLFTSLHWVAFLAAVFVAFHLVPASGRRWLMLAASVYFYASWSVRFLALIAFQLVIDWTCGELLSRTEDARWRKVLVAASVIVNLSVLALFKYYGLFSQTVTALGVRLPTLDVMLPLAISFYTFESMSYTIDVYRRQLRPVRSPVHLALFIIWFPHLIAGPIIRPSEFIPQLAAISPVTRERFFTGLSLMLLGYAKKLLGADWLATVVDPVFANPSLYSSTELLIAVYAYAFQIYLDFSAYTDIARGASRWFGIELPENFAAPYLATSITDFWRRWHMTLSHWLRDYLYISLGGSRVGRYRTYANLTITMLLGGLWHGASWTFLVWGGMHGAFLAVERALGVTGSEQPVGLAGVVRRVLTFHLVCVAWILFRAQTFADAVAVAKGFASWTFTIAPANALPMLGAVTIISAYWLARPLRRRVEGFVPERGWFGITAYVAAAVAGICVLMFLGASSNAFIYFRF